MKIERFAWVAGSLAFLAGCTFHVHVHEAPRAGSTGGERAQGVVSVDPMTVSGLVVDAEGRPARAHVALVFQEGGGSYGTTTDESGTFTFEGIPQKPCVLIADTEDSLAAVMPEIHPPRSDLTLGLQHGAVVLIKLEGRPSMRLAVFQVRQHHDPQAYPRVEDFSLRDEEQARIVVPPGDYRIELYSGSGEEQTHFVTVDAGDKTEVLFDLDEG